MPNTEDMTDQILLYLSTEALDFLSYISGIKGRVRSTFAAIDQGMDCGGGNPTRRALPGWQTNTARRATVMSRQRKRAISGWKLASIRQRGQAQLRFSLLCCIRDLFNTAVT